jgi:hypothetical protein
VEWPAEYSRNCCRVLSSARIVARWRLRLGLAALPWLSPAGPPKFAQHQEHDGRHSTPTPSAPFHKITRAQPQTPDLGRDSRVDAVATPGYSPQGAHNVVEG